MNCKEAKKIDLTDFLKSNYQCTKENHKEAWFLSPFRNEQSASFKVDKSKNVWYDHGEGFGGDIIDLIKKLNNNCSISEALKILANNSFSFLQHSIQTKNKFVEEEKHQLISSVALNNSALINYLHSRNINVHLAKKYCKEVTYSLKGKRYFAIGFPNDSNGYEIRNKYFKGNMIAKDVSYFENDMNVLVVFEGFMDFLSYRTLYPIKSLKSDYLILNSTSMMKQSLEVVNYSKYDTVVLFFDNNKAGNNLTLKLQIMKRLYQYFIANSLEIKKSSVQYDLFNSFNHLFKSHQNKSIEFYVNYILDNKIVDICNSNVLDFIKLFENVIDGSNIYNGFEDFNAYLQYLNTRE